MRVLIVEHRTRLPLQDCEWGSRMIQLFETPQANHHHIAPSLRRTLAGALLLGGIGYGLAVLLLTF